MEATYIGMYMWKQAVRRPSPFDVAKVTPPWAARFHRALGHHLDHGTRRTITCTRRCSSARSRPTASSTWSGRPKGPDQGQPWSPFIPGNDKKKDEPALMADKKA
jgi:urea transport system substrate-binding protein